MEKISAKQLANMEKEGSVKRKKTLPERKPESVNRVIERLDQAAMNKLDAMENIANRKLEEMNRVAVTRIEALLLQAQKTESDQQKILADMVNLISQKKTAYRFVINRNTKGTMESVDAHPIEGAE